MPASSLSRSSPARSADTTRESRCRSTLAGSLRLHGARERPGRRRRRLLVLAHAVPAEDGLRDPSAAPLRHPQADRRSQTSAGCHAEGHSRHEHEVVCLGRPPEWSRRNVALRSLDESVGGHDGEPDIANELELRDELLVACRPLLLGGSALARRRRWWGTSTHCSFAQLDCGVPGRAIVGDLLRATSSGRRGSGVTLGGGRE
jgi:hypothetical protein